MVHTTSNTLVLMKMDNRLCCLTQCAKVLKIIGAEFMLGVWLFFFCYKICFRQQLFGQDWNTNVCIVYACATGGSCCDVREYLILPGCDAVSIGKNITNVKIKYSPRGEIYSGISFWHRIWTLEYQSIILFELWSYWFTSHLVQLKLFASLYWWVLRLCFCLLPNFEICKRLDINNNVYCFCVFVKCVQRIKFDYVRSK